MQAKVVIIGGGIVGAAAAYHLANLGWKDILIIDKGALPHNDGSTSHAPGGVVVASTSKIMTEFAEYSSDLYKALPPYADDARQYNAVGGIEIARSRERWQDMIRLHTTVKSYGIETHLLTPHEVTAKIPLVDPDTFTGGLFVPKSAIINGSYIVGSFLEEAEKTGGVTVVSNTGVTELEVKNGQIVAVHTNNREMPRIACEQALLAANIWAPAISEPIGVKIPLMAFEHQYTITDPLPRLANFDRNNPDDEIIYPTARDLDKALYFRQHFDSYGVGSYWHEPHLVRPKHVKKTAIHPFTPHDFAEAWDLTTEIIPDLKGRELVTKFNGMFAFSVDGMPIIGETQVKGFWTACASWITHAGGVAKSVAEWMTHGEAEWDMRQCNVMRFQPHAQTDRFVTTITKKNYREVYAITHPRQPLTEPRNVRLSPFHTRHEALGVTFTPFAGIELPNWYAENVRLLEKYETLIPERTGWGSEYWSRVQGAEHLEVRNNAGMFDLTGLSIIEIAGKGAVDYANYLCGNEMDKPVNSVIYTCWLTQSGGIKRDLTAARMAHDRYWFFVGEGTLPQDFDWVRQHAPENVHVSDVSNAYSAIGVWGPNARHILQKVTDTDMGNEAFPYYSAQWIDIGMTPVFAMRISYVGELGWELHIPIDQSLAVWDALWEAGREFGMITAGMGAMDSLRLEKGYRLWGGDIYSEHNVYEAGLGWTVRLKKEGDFIGKAATKAIKAHGTKKKLVALTLTDPKATLLGYEPLFHNDEQVGYVTTANYGYSVGRYIAYGYLPKELAKVGTELQVEYFNERYPIVVSADPLYDKSMIRMKN